MLGPFIASFQDNPQWLLILNSGNKTPSAFWKRATLTCSPSATAEDVWLLRLGHKGIDCSFLPHCLGLLALEEARFHATPLKQTYIWRLQVERNKPPPTASSVYQLCEWTALTGLILHPQSSIRWLHPCLMSACNLMRDRKDQPWPVRQDHTWVFALSSTFEN